MKRGYAALFKFVKSQNFDGKVKRFIYKTYYFFRNEAIHVVCRVSEKILQPA